MPPRFECEECRAIYLELCAAHADGRQYSAVEGDLASFLAQLDDEYCARMRETSFLWDCWRRLKQHRALTGHYLPVFPAAPGSLMNPN